MKCELCGLVRAEGNTNKFWRQHLVRCKERGITFTCVGCRMSGPKPAFDEHIKRCELMRICRYCGSHVQPKPGEDRKTETEHEQKCGATVACPKCGVKMKQYEIKEHPCTEDTMVCRKCRGNYKRKAYDAHQLECPEVIV